MIDTSILMPHKTLEDVMLLLIQGSIFLEGQVYLLLSVCALSKLIFGAICLMIYVAYTKVLIINELVTHPSAMMFHGWL